MEIRYVDERMQEENPWKSGSKLKKPKVKAVIFEVLALFAASCGYVFFRDELLSFAILAVLFAYVATQAKAPYPVALVLGLAVLPTPACSFARELFGNRWFFTENIYALSTVILSTVVGIAATAILCTEVKRGTLALLVPFSAFVLGAAVYGNLWYGLSAFLLLPPALLLILGTIMGQGRTRVIAFCEIGLALSLTAVLFTLFNRQVGVVEKSNLVTFLSDLKSQATSGLSAFRDSYLELFSQMGDSAGTQAVEKLSAYFSPTVLSALVDGVFSVLPGIALMICGILSYEAQLLFQVVSIRTMGAEKRFPAYSRMFVMSLPAGVICAFSFIVSVFAQTTTLFAAVCDNLFLILAPGFFLVGLQTLLVRFLRMKSGGKIALIALAVGALCCYSSAFLSAMSFYGSVETVLSPIRKKIFEKMKDQDGPRDS